MVLTIANSNIFLQLTELGYTTIIPRITQDHNRLAKFHKDLAGNNWVEMRLGDMFRYFTPREINSCALYFIKGAVHTVRPKELA